jgi:hypothetical protein
MCNHHAQSKECGRLAENPSFFKLSQVPEKSTLRNADKDSTVDR